MNRLAFWRSLGTMYAFWLTYRITSGDLSSTVSWLYCGVLGFVILAIISSTGVGFRWRWHPRKRIPKRRESVPVLAWKMAQLAQMDDGELVFMPTGAGCAYSTDDEATCYRAHKSPRLDCNCGFYAMRDQVLPWYNKHLLQVELSGRVLVGKHGYRAQHQSVIAVYLGICMLREWHQRMDSFLLPATGVICAALSEPLRPAQPHRHGWARKAEAKNEAHVIVSVCDACAAYGDGIPGMGQVLTAAELSAIIGIEVHPGLPGDA